jgi:hypothetical protein
MRNDKHLALKLRKQGKSYAKIGKELNIPKSTLSEWFSKAEWSCEIKKELTRKAIFIAKKRLRLIVARRREYWEKLREKYRQKARNEFPRFLNDPLFVAGISLYWGEGHSKMQGGRVELANVDPRMISIFARFLTEIAKISKEKIRVWLILYTDLSEKRCKSFWSQASGIPETQFYKTQFIKGRHKTKKLENGICEIQTYNRELKEKIFTWINMLYNELHSSARA